jgi:hypothetical protein
MTVLDASQNQLVSTGIAVESAATGNSRVDSASQQASSCAMADASSCRACTHWLRNQCWSKPATSFVCMLFGEVGQSVCASVMLAAG